MTTTTTLRCRRQGGGGEDFVQGNKKRALKRVMERYRKELNMWESLFSTFADMKSKIPSTLPSPPPPSRRRHPIRRF
ncbi:hypothetical protein QJS10_CPA06g00755 [Acorus calamus]|uniref:Uncharacterized protein n=1 Tax=Acorus calamus TaxID=4465 RepID=A0AAV9EJB8_ACOCL|nr:hypothetical protein QJS10_CPA06g00755 [Acorus calamus]